MTTRSTSPLLLAAALAFAGIGCSQDCESLCEDSKDCKNADRNEDCANTCEHTEQLNEDADCEDQYGDFLNCTYNAADICRVGDACESEAIKWTDCLTKFCQNPKNEKECD